MERARKKQEPITLRSEDDEVDKRPTRRAKRQRTQADFEEFLSTFGAWADVDTEQLKAVLKAARGSNRPPIKL